MFEWLFGLALLFTLYFIAYRTVESKNTHAKVVAEIVKSLIPILIVSLLAFAFKKQIYLHFIRGSLEANIQDCKIENDKNKVWSCTVSLRNYRDGTVNQRKYEFKPTVSNFHFEECLSENFSEVKKIESTDQYSCKYLISLQGNSEVSLTLKISGNEKKPEIDIREIL